MGLSGSRRARSALKIGLALSDGRGSGIQNGNLGVSLIHYSGKNAVFLPLKKVLPLVSNCLDDHRYHVQMAVGWVLREMGRVYGSEVTKYLEAHAERMSTSVFSRAIERLSSEERTRLREMRKIRLA
jgi:hypothetical protein